MKQRTHTDSGLVTGRRSRCLSKLFAGMAAVIGVLMPGSLGVLAGANTLETNILLYAGRSIPVSTGRTVSGPWGKLSVKDFVLEPPAVLIDVASCERESSEWYIGGEPADLWDELKEIGVDDADIGVLKDSAQSADVGNGVRLKPPDSIIAGLSVGARATLYHELSTYSENYRCRQPLRILKSHVQYWLADETLDERQVSLIAEFMYCRDNYWLLSDVSTLLRSLETSDEKVRVMQVLLRQVVASVTVSVPNSKALETVKSYWRYPPRYGADNDAVLALLDVASRRHRDVALADLLPVIPRNLLDRYPADSGAVVKDCHWTSMNFFTRSIEEAVDTANTMPGYLLTHYNSVQGTPQFGDVIVLMNKKKEAVHSCNYLAGDLVFTKNGCSSDRPWSVMRMSDMLAIYTLYEPVDMLLFRRRDMGDGVRDLTSLGNPVSCGKMN